MNIIRQCLAFGGALIIAAQIVFTWVYGSAACLNQGCEIVERLTRISPMLLNIVGLLFFLFVGWLLRRQRDGGTHWPETILLAGLAVDSVLLGYQIFVARTLCAYCLLVFVLLVALNLMGGRRQLLAATGVAAAVVIGFSLLTFVPPAGGSGAVTIENGSYGQRNCSDPSKQIYLIFSENCPHCRDVLQALENCNSCDLYLNPVDRIDDLSFSGVSRSDNYSPEVNRTILSLFGIQEVPVLLVKNHDGYQFIKGSARIIAYVEKACFKQQPLLYLEHEQLSEESGISVFADESGECSLQIDCPQ